MQQRQQQIKKQFFLTVNHCYHSKKIIAVFSQTSSSNSFSLPPFKTALIFIFLHFKPANVTWQNGVKLQIIWHNISFWRTAHRLTQLEKQLSWTQTEIVLILGLFTEGFWTAALPELSSPHAHSTHPWLHELTNERQSQKMIGTSIISNWLAVGIHARCTRRREWNLIERF